MQATLVIKNIGSLITLKGDNGPRKGKLQSEIGELKNGIVAVENDRIIYVGSGELPDNIDSSKARVIDAKGMLVTPGLIDCHTHLVHGGSRENELAMKLEGKGYLEILASGGGIHSTAKATKEASFDELYNKAYKSLDIMKSFGITTVEGKSGYGIGSFETEIKQMEVAKKLNKDHPLTLISTFMGAHAVPKEYKEDSNKFVDILVDEMLPRVKEMELAKFCDVFCEEGVFTIDQSRRILLKAKELGFVAKIHADEIVSLGGAELAAEVGAISAEHLVGASDKGIEDMAKEGVVAVLLPGTSFNLGKKQPAKARFMIEKGVPVALSTDYNPGSCPTENLQFIMTLAALHLKMRPDEIVTGVTMNAAAALGIQNEVGSIEVGKKADLAIFDIPNIEYMIYHFGINHNFMTIKDGEVVYTR